MSNKPLSVDQTLTKARTLAKKGAPDQAMLLYQDVLARFPGNKRAIEGQKSLAKPKPDQVQNAVDVESSREQANGLLALHKQGRLQDVLAQGAALAERYPSSLQILNILGAANVESGRLDEAVSLYARILRLQPDYAKGHYNLGNVLSDLGRHEQAIGSYRQAVKIKPDFAEAYNNMGNAYRGLGQLDEAIASYRLAVAAKPDFADAHNNLGFSLGDLGKIEDAIDCYYKAIAIKPDFTVAYTNLTSVLEKTNRTEALREAVSNATRDCGASPRLSLSKARLLKRDGDNAAALAVLEGMPEPVADANFMATRAFLCGDLCDRIGDAAAAFDYFSEGNRLRREVPGAIRDDRGRYLSQIDVLAKCFTADWVADWQPPESDDARPDPVFLVGFPRSGTTLLDSILRSHAAISVVEEGPMLHSVRTALGGLPAGYPGGLATLDPTQLAALRRTYFAELDRQLGSESRTQVVIDKLPLHTIHAGLIHRIFPEARFLFAQRHPCDCVLSCFMQDFKLNYAMVNFLDLTDAANLYDRAMSLWQQYQVLLPLKVHTVRYETLVEALEETVTPIFDFLGVGWDDRVLNYAETALSRGKINTPSYNQVTQPLYTRARGRWERYRENLQPVLPLLLPWARQFGYDE